MSSTEGWSEVSAQASGTWYPNKEGDTKETMKDIPAGPTSYLEGYYEGFEEKEVKGNNSRIHTLIFTGVGNPKSILSNTPIEKFERVSFFGSFIVNEKLAEVTQGTLIRISWEGKLPPKTPGGKPYNMFKVMQNTSVEPFNFSKGVPAAASTQPDSQAAVPAQSNSTEGLLSDDAENDDLPF